MKKLLLSLTTLFLMSCGGGSETETSSDLLSGEVKIDGSSTVYPITETLPLKNLSSTKCKSYCRSFRNRWWI